MSQDNQEPGFSNESLSPLKKEIVNTIEEEIKEYNELLKKYNKFEDSDYPVLYKARARNIFIEHLEETIDK